MSTSWTSRAITRRTMLTGLGLGSAVALAACTTGTSKNADPTAAVTSGGASSSAAPAPPATLTVSVADGATDVAPAGLSVVAAGGTLDAVTLTGPGGTPVEGVIDAATATWRPAGKVEYGTTYTLTASATNPDGVPAQAAATFTTAKPKSFAFASIGPLDGMVVGVAMPVRVYLDKPAADRKTVEQAMTVTSAPAQPGSWSWFSDTEVHWRPQQYWQANTTVQVDVNLYGVHLGNGVWGKENRTIGFTVAKSQVAKCDTNEHQLHCYENGQLVKSIPISAGLEEPGRYTKSGVHVVTDKIEKMTMDSTTYGLALDAGGYQTEVYWATRLSNNGEFVHAAPWSIADQGVRNVSHGCLNASPANAKWFLQWSQVGDPVEITGTPVPLTVDDGDIFDWTIPWETWVQGSANK